MRKDPYIDCSKCDSMVLYVGYKGFDYKNIKESQLIETDSLGKDVNSIDLCVDSSIHSFYLNYDDDTTFIAYPDEIILKKNVKYKLRLKDYNDLVLNIEVLDFRIHYMCTMVRCRVECILNSYMVNGLLIELLGNYKGIIIDKKIVDSLSNE